MKPKIIVFLFFTLTLLICSKENNIIENKQTIEIPLSNLDYGSMNNWAIHPNKNTILKNYNLNIAVINENLHIENVIPITNNSYTNTGIDVFFVHPTILTQNAEPAKIVIQNQPESYITVTIIAQGALLSKYGRMFAPRYRQSSGKTYREETDKELQASIVAVSYRDAKAAFLDYLNNYNNGNKFILVAHSQGSFLLAMSLRDVFDNDENMPNKLIIAALGGMEYVYAPENNYASVWWENIPLCKTSDECGCVHNWTSFDEDQTIPDIDFRTPMFYPFLLNAGLVYRPFNESEDWFVQDFSYFSTQTQRLRFCITPDATYNLGEGNNFIDFDNLYNVRYKREGLTKVVLSIKYNPEINAKRSNDLANQVFLTNYEIWDYQIKDYHI